MKALPNALRILPGKKFVLQQKKAIFLVDDSTDRILEARRGESGSLLLEAIRSPFQ